MALITGTKIKFVYVPTGTAKPEPAVDGAVYFIEETKEIYVGDVLVASAGINVSITGTGNNIQNAAYDATTRTLTLTKGDIDIPEYTIVEGEAGAGHVKTYSLQKDGVTVGASINIPKDLVVASGTVRVVDAVDVPYEGAQIGDKYIDLALNDAAEDHIYIPVKDLVDVYTAGAGITISDADEIAIDEEYINDMIDAKALTWNVVTTNP